MKIRTQLLVLGMTGILLILIVGVLSIYAKRKVDTALEANTLLTTVLRKHGEADMMHDSLRGDVYEAIIAGQAGDAEHLKEVQKEFAEHAANFKSRIEANGKLALDADTSTRLKTLQGPLEAYIRAAEALIVANRGSAAPQIKAFQSAFEALEKPMAAFSDYLEEAVKQRKQEVDAATQLVEWLTFVMMIVGVALIAVLGLLILRSVGGVVEGVQGAVDDLRASSGDLTRRVPPIKGEFAGLSTSLNDFIGGLRDIVSRVRDSAENIGVSSQQVEQGNHSLSSRTEQQAAALEETASSMEEFTTTVKRNAENAQRANELAQGASQVARHGGETVRGVVTTMQAISESSRQIADIIGVIDSIAFQTNILALNAAVEAARAGDQGRGFAVVASEVRALAQRSAQAAREIKTMIQASVEKVDGGMRFVGDAGKTMDDIVAAVTEVTTIISDISVASRAQLDGIEQVNRAISDIDTSTQQNAAIVEQSTAAATSMADQARDLLAAVARFKLNESDVSSASAARAPQHVPASQRAAPPAATRRVLQHHHAANALPPRARDTPKGDGEWKEF